MSQLFPTSCQCPFCCQLVDYGRYARQQDYTWCPSVSPPPKVKLTLSYGYLQMSSATGLKDRRSLPPHKLLNRRDLTIKNDNGGSSDGQIMFEALISQGALAPNGQGGYDGAGGFTRYWDSCSSTVSHFTTTLLTAALDQIRSIWSNCHV